MNFLRLQPSIPLLTPTTGGSLTSSGTYSYNITFVSDSGGESQPSIEGITATGVQGVTLAGGQNAVAITLPPTTSSSRLLEWRIYRLGGTSSVWRLVASLPATLTSYIDIIADSNLGAVTTPSNANRPFTPKTFCISGHSVILLNLTDDAGVGYPCGIQVSTPDSYDLYDQLTNFFEVEPSFGHALLWGIDFNGFVFFARDDLIGHFDPTNLTNLPFIDIRAYGGANVKGVCLGENGIYFLSSGMYIIRFDGSSFQDISQSGGSKIRNYLLSIPAEDVKNVVMEYYDHCVLVSIPTSSSTTSAVVLVYDTLTSRWYVINSSTWDASALYSTGTSLYLGSSSGGKVCLGFVGDDDLGTPITSHIVLRDDDCGVPEIMKYHEKVFIYGKCEVPGVTVSTIVLQRLDTTIVGALGTVLVGGGFGRDVGFGVAPFGTSITIPLTNYINACFGGVDGLGAVNTGYQGTYVGLEILSQGRITLRSIVQVIRLLEPTYVTD